MRLMTTNTVLQEYCRGPITTVMFITYMIILVSDIAKGFKQI